MISQMWTLLGSSLALILVAVLPLNIDPKVDMESVSVPGKSLMSTARSSPGDLEIGGELTGLPAGTTRYVRYEDLLTLPQVSFKIADDPNFKGTVEVSGVPLTELAETFGQAKHSDMIVAICYDRYRSNYPRDYVDAHRPLLVLKINGKLRTEWPSSEEGGSMAPYLISHPTFKPSFTVLSHQDEAQIPFGVTRLEFRTESVVYGGITPKGRASKATLVQQGYQIARQDCFRCHGLDGEGGELAARSWLILGAWAATDEAGFKRYVHRPQDVQAGAKMLPHSSYDDATLTALVAYFKTFVPARKTQ